MQERLVLRLIEPVLLWSSVEAYATRGLFCTKRTKRTLYTPVERHRHDVKVQIEKSMAVHEVDKGRSPVGDSFGDDRLGAIFTFCKLP